MPHSAETAAAGPVAGTPFTPFDPFAEDAPAAGQQVDAGQAGQGSKVPPMPQCFASIAPGLLDQVRTKLRSRDLTKAHCVLSTGDGYKHPEPVPMTFLMAGDFAQECAAQLGRYGLIRVSVFEPESREPWHFAFRVAMPQGFEAPKVDPLAEVRRLLAENEARIARMLETMRLESQLGGGGGGDNDLLRTIEKLRAAGIQIGGQQGANVPDFAAYARAQAEAMNAMFEGVNRMRDTAAKFAPTEKSATDKAVDELLPKALGDIYGVARQKFMASGQAAAPAATQPSPVSPAANPFAETA